MTSFDIFLDEIIIACIEFSNVYFSNGSFKKILFAKLLPIDFTGPLKLTSNG